MTTPHATPDRPPSPAGPSPAPPPSGGHEFRTDVVHSARVYNYWLGGKDNFEVDRVVGEKVKKAVPQVPMMARANRDFMHRATRTLVRDAGIRQILDIGTGLPTDPNLHEVAQQIAPETRIVYVDNDPLVLTHARALLTSTPDGLCAYVDADLADPRSILTAGGLTTTLDLTRPVAVMLGAILMLLPDELDPWSIVATLTDAVPAGSYLVISHPAADMNPDAMAAVTAIASKQNTTFVARSHDQVAAFFAGHELIEPGLVPVLAWRPDTPPEDPEAAYYWAGVART